MGECSELIRYNYQIKHILTLGTLWNTVLPKGPYYIVSYGPIYRDEIALFRLERYIENVISSTKVLHFTVLCPADIKPK